MSFSTRWLALGLATGAALVTGLAPSYAQSEPDAQPRIIFHIDVDHITESSSLAVSTVHPRLVNTTNDSGDGPYVYVLNRSGELVGTTTRSAASRRSTSRRSQPVPTARSWWPTSVTTTDCAPA